MKVRTSAIGITSRADQSILKFPLCPLNSRAVTINSYSSSRLLQRLVARSKRRTRLDLDFRQYASSITPKTTIAKGILRQKSGKMVIGDIERLSDVTKLSAHVTRILGQNPGLMTLQGTNSYLLQPPSNPHAPLILIDTSSPHTANQYVDLLLVHLHHLALESGTRETHFESNVAKASLDKLPEDQVEQVKQDIIAERAEDKRKDEMMLLEYGPGSNWTSPPTNAQQNAHGGRKLPPIEHIVLTHRHLDHVGALPVLLRALEAHGCPPPKLWKFPSPDEALLNASERDRPTSDGELWQSLPAPNSGSGTGPYYQSFSPLQPFHPIIPGLMISIIDPVYKKLLKHDKDGKPKWNQVPEIARVSIRCLKTPGHTQDSVSLVMQEGEKGVFTGDTVLGQGTTTFLDLASYMTSLRTLLALKPNVLYPAHGPHLPNAAESKRHLEEYISHRQTREDQIVAILRQLAKSSPTTAIVESKHDSRSGSDLKAEAPTGADGEGAPSLPAVLIELKRSIHLREEAENKAKGPLMVDKRKALPLPSFKGELSTLMRAEKEGTRLQGQIPISVLCRLLYKSEDEKLIFAATKSVGAHLFKLAKEGKVKKGEATWAKLVGKEVLFSSEEATRAGRAVGADGDAKEEWEQVEIWQYIGEDVGGDDDQGKKIDKAV